MTFKKDFPIFKNNPNLIYLDSTASSQKPSLVIDGIKTYLETNYSNIHRGLYDIAINSEELYKDSKKIVAKHLGVSDYKEIIYSFNSTYASNLLVSSLGRSNILKKGDKVLLSIAEHHANIVPWLILKEDIGIEVIFIGIDENFNIDLKDFEKKYDEKVKVISFTHVSNVLGQIFDLEEIGKRKRNNTLFFVDGSQSVPHFEVNVKKLNCDALFFTGHKVLADSGIGILWGKKEFLNSLKPAFSGGGAIGDVTCEAFTSSILPDKFEPGTPNMTGAVSLLKAFEYIENIGGFEAIEKVEKDLVSYFLEEFKKRDFLQMLGSLSEKNRVGVFSFVVKGEHSHDVGEILAENGIAIRAGKHCAHPLMEKLGFNHSLRASFYLYNSKEEIYKLFEVLDQFKK